MPSISEYYTNENGIIELVEKKSNSWKVRWIKWPNVEYAEELPENIDEDTILSEFMKVKEFSVDEKCGCIRVVC
jgi:hypothetical protein